MGLTTESLHIRTDVPPVELLTRLMAKEGFEPCGDEAARRTLFVLPGNGWQTVLDSVIFQRNSLAKQLSKDAEVVSMRVEDSDITDVSLWSRGKKLPLAPEIAPLLKAKTLFAEANLAGVARELGIDPHHCTCTLEDLLESPPPGAIRLSFVSGIEEPSGPPMFQVMFPPHGHMLQPGGPLEPFGFSLRNNGATANGVRIVLRGDALRQGLACVDRVNLGRPSKAKLKETRGLEPQAGGEEWTVEAPEFVFPGMPKFTGKSANSVAIVNAAFHASMVHITLTGRVMLAGRGELEVVVVPMEHPKGAATVRAELRVGLVDPVPEDPILPPFEERG